MIFALYFALGDVRTTAQAYHVQTKMILEILFELSVVITYLIYEH